MELQYLGVDVAGADNTWKCVLTSGNGELALVEQPKPVSLKRIVEYAEEHPVVAVAIDAQLTWAVSEETGFRSSDDELREMLPPGCQNWVASQNSLMAVPVRGRQLAEMLSPIVGTIIETHPRACLCFADKLLLESVKLYKKSKGHARELWEAWANRFSIKTTVWPASDVGDGALDALVCATVGYLFHNSPWQLKHLRQTSVNKRGRGPFFVLRPD